MKKILVVEDEAAIREFIVINLKRSGYDVIEADCGEAALEEYEKNKLNIDVILLDVMMPGIDGITVCKEIRKVNSTVGIMMLTAKTQEMDKVAGLMLGADDYMTKPFSPSELVARVDALYRRVVVSSAKHSINSTVDKIQLGEFVLDLRKHTFTKNGEIIDLTQVEFQIVQYFFENPNIPLGRIDILNRVWGTSFFGEDKIVDVNIRRIRIKVEEEPSRPQHLVTVWGIGYKWEC